MLMMSAVYMKHKHKQGNNTEDRNLKLHNENKINTNYIHHF